MERFMTPASSSKMRKLAILRDSHARSASVSAGLTPQSTRRPCPIDATVDPPITTLASRTRWRRARMSSAHDLALDVAHLAVYEGDGRERVGIAGNRQIRPLPSFLAPGIELHVGTADFVHHFGLGHSRSQKPSLVRVAAPRPHCGGSHLRFPRRL